MQRITLGLALIGLAFATPSLAQSRNVSSLDIPPGLRPAAGKCRIWIDGVPAARQPAPMDCKTALERRPAGSWVIFGEDVRVRRPRRGDIDDRRQRRARNDRDSDSDRDSDRDSDSDSDRHRRRRDRDRDDCIDRNRDGWCDSDRRRREDCVDRNRDGRCDEVIRGRRRSGTFEEIAAVILTGGVRP